FDEASLNQLAKRPLRFDPKRKPVEPIRLIGWNKAILDRHRIVGPRKSHCTNHRVVNREDVPAVKHCRSLTTNVVEEVLPVPGDRHDFGPVSRSEEHTSELQSRFDLVCRLLLEKKKINYKQDHST